MRKLYFLLSTILLPFLVAAQDVNIPDANFKAALVANTNINTNGDSEIQVSEAEAFTGAIHVSSMGIESLIGIEAFTALTELSCSSNSLEELDVSNNVELRNLGCFSNSLISLDLSKNTKLQFLFCASNSLNRLDLSKNTELYYLDCYRTSLSHLDLSYNTKLNTLYCNKNYLSHLDLSNNSELTTIVCNSNSLISLDVSNGNNSIITDFNATYNPNLSCIKVSDAIYATDNWTDIDAGVTFSTDCSSTPVHIPDANFKAAIVANTAINTNGDDEIQFSEAETFAGALDVSGLDISDMTGLEAFTSLTDLNCSYNSLSSLNISKNITLLSLNCMRNQLISLDVSGNTALLSLDCTYNQLGSLNVSNNTALTNLACYSNKLNSLDLSTNTALTNLNCHTNLLKSLDVSKNTSLTSLQCHNNQLSILNLKNGNNDLLTDFNATNNPSLTCISVDDVAYATANWTGIDAGVVFSEDCGAQIVQIPDANFKAYLVGNTVINSNGDNEIQVSEAESYSGDIMVYNQGISDLTGIEAFLSIEELNCSDNTLTSLDVSNNVALKKLYCNSNSIANLDISHNILLENFQCENNLLASLDISKNVALFALYCGGNSLTEIDVNHNTLLQYFNCSYNTLTSLDISQNTLLTGLYCNNNTLESLDVSNNTLLDYLFCSDNSTLVDLDVSNNILLEYLNCSNNAQETLDVSKNVALTQLYCYGNNLTNLDLRNNNNNLLTTLDATRNPDLSCISVSDINFATENWKDINPWTVFDLDCGFVVDFTSDQSTGEAPLVVQFSDATIGSPQTWSWDFDNDGIEDSNEQNPLHSFATPGFYTVSLLVNNGTISKSEIKTAFINVNEPAITGLNDVISNRLLSYPNPTSQFITIDFDTEIKSIKMINSRGLSVFEKSMINQPGSKLEIDVSAYKAGEYIMLLTNDDLTIPHKVMIIK